MKNHLRKIILLMVSIITLFITSIAATYAWMSVNLATYVTNLQLTVHAGNGISISKDGINFSSKITEEEAKEALVVKYLGYSYNDLGKIVNKNKEEVNLTSEDINKHFKQLAFKPVTTLNGKDFYSDKYNLTRVNETSGNYISLDLYFKATVVQSEPVSVFFNTSNFNYDGDGNMIRKFGISGEEKVSSSDITKTDFLISNLTTVDPSGAAIEYQRGYVGLAINGANAMRFTTKIDDTIKFYEPYMGLGSYATNLDSGIYTNMYKQASMYDASKNAAFTYVNNQKDDQNKFDPLDYEDIPNTFKGFDSLEATKICDLDTTEEKKVTKVTFTFWLEGWDADCFDTIISSALSISLSFTANQVSLFEQLKKVRYHNGEEVVTRNYFDYEDVKDIYLPQTTSDKKFIGWYNNDYTERFDFSILTDTTQSEFDLYANWQ